MQILGRVDQRVGHHHQCTAVEQRTEDLPAGDVEAVRMPLRPHLSRADGNRSGQRRHQLRDVVVGNRHPLRHARGSRGVGDVGDVVRGRRRQCGSRTRRDSRIVGLEYCAARFGQSRTEFGRGDHADRGGIGKHEVQPRRGHRRIDRQIRRAALEHGQHRYDRLGRTRQQQRHTLTRPRAPGDQQLRQPVRGLVQPTVAPRAALEPHRQRLGRPGHLCGEDFGDGHRRRRRTAQPRGVGPVVEPGTLIVDEQVQR